MHCIFASGIPLCYICKQKLHSLEPGGAWRNIGCHEELTIYEVSITNLVKLSLPPLCYEQEWMVGSTAQSCSSDVFVAMIHLFLNPLYTVACTLPVGLPILTSQYLICFMTLTDVVAVAVFETVCLCCEWYRHKGRLMLTTTPLSTN